MEHKIKKISMIIKKWDSDVRQNNNFHIQLTKKFNLKTNQSNFRKRQIVKDQTKKYEIFLSKKL